MKIYVHGPNENWILDRYVKEWNQYNPSVTADNIEDCDILWMIDDWTWDRVDPYYLENKFVVATICHIEPNKYDHASFEWRDSFVNHYHAMSNKSADVVRMMTDKPVTSLQFWINDHLWSETIDDVSTLRRRYELPLKKVLVGSFQRDTEGHDLISPKLEKGPDIFCDYMEAMKSHIGENLEVVLAGWRRQYVINRLEAAGIKYHYFEFCDFDVLNDLYNCIDLYVVGSRIEGGPQSIPECAITRTPIISTDVGLASEILSPKSVNDNLNEAMPDVDYAYRKVDQYRMENHFPKFVNFFEELL